MKETANIIALLAFLVACGCGEGVISGTPRQSADGRVLLIRSDGLRVVVGSRVTTIQGSPPYALSASGDVLVAEQGPFSKLFNGPVGVMVVDLTQKPIKQERVMLRAEQLPAEPGVDGLRCTDEAAVVRIKDSSKVLPDQYWRLDLATREWSLQDQVAFEQMPTTLMTTKGDWSSDEEGYGITDYHAADGRIVRERLHGYEKPCQVILIDTEGRETVLNQAGLLSTLQVWGHNTGTVVWP